MWFSMRQPCSPRPMLLRNFVTKMYTHIPYNGERHQHTFVGFIWWTHRAPFGLIDLRSNQLVVLPSAHAGNSVEFPALKKLLNFKTCACEPALPYLSCHSLLIHQMPPDFSTFPHRPCSNSFSFSPGHLIFSAQLPCSHYLSSALLFPDLHSLTCFHFT